MLDFSLPCTSASGQDSPRLHTMAVMHSLSSTPIKLATWFTCFECNRTELFVDRSCSCDHIWVCSFHFSSDQQRGSAEMQITCSKQELAQIVSQLVDNKLAETYLKKKKGHNEPPLQLAAPAYTRHMPEAIVRSLYTESKSMTMFMRQLTRGLLTERKDYTTPVKGFNDNQREKMRFLKACIDTFFPSQTRLQQSEAWSSCMLTFNDCRHKIRKLLENRDNVLYFNAEKYRVYVVKRDEDE